VPADWKIIQGPVMLSSIRSNAERERRPKFGLTWEQNPPTLDEFQRQLLASVSKRRHAAAPRSRKFRLSRTHGQGTHAGKGFQITAEIWLIRVSDFAGYQIICESMQIDTAAAEPFSPGSWQSESRPASRASKLPVVND
jgi:hypothetical protein